MPIQTINSSLLANNSILPSKMSMAYPGTNTIFRQCASFSEFASGWLWSGNAGARTSAPTTLGSDPVFSNYNYDTSSWTEIDVSTFGGNSYQNIASTENFYWYLSKLFYITAGTFTYSGYVDDDEAWYLLPYGGGTPVYAGGDISDNSGTGATTWTRSVTVPTSGFYRFVGRGIDGGGGSWTSITSIDSGLSNFWVPDNTCSAGQVLQVIHSDDNSVSVVSGSTCYNTGIGLVSASIKPTKKGSRIMVIASVSGAAEDDLQVEMQRDINNAGYSFIYGGSASGATGSSARQAFGDYSMIRSGVSGMENKMTVKFTCHFVDLPNTTSLVTYRAFARGEGPFYYNRPINTDGLGNGNGEYNISSITLMEISG